MTVQTILILGAHSDMARAIAKRFASSGFAVQLAARQSQRLDADVQDLHLRFGITATAVEFDALKIETHQAFVESLAPLPDIVVSCVGYMGDQQKSEASSEEAAIVMRSNFEGPASVLGCFAAPFISRGSGVLVGVSSVAGERGRATNYVYGAAKAGFTAFLSGLRNRLATKGVAVITVLPGFVNTAMTQGMNLPARLTAEPSEVANAVFAAVTKGRDVVYVRPIWRVVMLVIRNIPERLFKRMKI